MSRLPCILADGPSRHHLTSSQIDERQEEIICLEILKVSRVEKWGTFVASSIAKGLISLNKPLSRAKVANDMPIQLMKII